MTTYSGPATVATEDAEYPVTADLAISAEPNGRKEWHGYVTSQSEADAWAIFNADSPRLRIGSDREGKIVPTRIDATDLQVQGSGAPPFGD